MKAQAIKLTSVVFAVVIARFAVPPMVSAANTVEVVTGLILLAMCAAVVVLNFLSLILGDNKV